MIQPIIFPRIIKSLIFFICLFSFPNLSAQDSTSVQPEKPFDPKFYFTVGAFQPTVSTTLQINGKNGPGAVFSLEDNLGFSDRPWLVKAEGVWDITKRSGVLLTYVKLDRSQEWIADRDVNIFDTTFHVNAKLRIFFNTTFIATSYRYSIFSKPNWNAGLAFGIRFLQIKTGVDLVGNNLSGYSESVNIPAPAPVFGIFGNALMTNRLQLHYNFDYFKISFNGVSGGVLDNRFALEYFILKNLGVGSSVSFLGFEVKEVPLAKDFDGDIKYTLNGISFFIAARF